MLERIRQGLAAFSHEALVSGIGIGCTGRMDAEGVFEANSFLPNLEGRNLTADLGLAFGVPAAVENDADAAALGARYSWEACTVQFLQALTFVPSGETSEIEPMMATPSLA